MLILSGCIYPEEPPENLLNEETMVKALVEVHLLESKVNKLVIKRDSLEQIYDHYELMLFDKLEIDKSYYDESMRYYLRHPRKLEAIYDTVLDTLNLRSKNKILD